LGLDEQRAVQVDRSDRHDEAWLLPYLPRRSLVMPLLKLKLR
jgi:hypothetical protein